jgi:DNA replication protein DnaC
MNQTIKRHAQQLRLSGLLNSLELRLQEAESNRLPYSQFLELVLQDELHVRHQRQIVRRNKSADFREQRNLEDFDFRFNPSVPRGRIYELAACHFIRQLVNDNYSSLRRQLRSPSLDSCRYVGGGGLC